MLQRTPDGYLLTIVENSGCTVLAISDDGRVRDITGSKVELSDIHIAMDRVPRDLKAKIWAWWKSR